MLHSLLFRVTRNPGFRPSLSTRDLPGGAVLGVLEHDAHGEEFVADAVGFGEVLGFAGGGARPNLMCVYF